MKWRSRIVKELIFALFLLIWVSVISEALTKAYPMFPLLFFGVIAPAEIILIHVFFILKSAKRGMKWIVVAALGLTSPFLSLALCPSLGPEWIILLSVGFLIWIFGLWRAKRATHSSDKEALEVRAPETPKSFMKKCAKCGREISIASEQCPFCGQTQP